MTKSELATIVAQGADLDKSTAVKSVEVVMKAISNALEKGEEVTLRGFGTFSAKYRA